MYIEEVIIIVKISTKNFLAVILVAVLIFVFNGNTVSNAIFNNDEDIIVFSDNSAKATAKLEISSNIAKCTSNLQTDSATALSITMELQKQNSSAYETVKTWEASKSGTNLSLSKSRVVSSSATYRLKVTFTTAFEIRVVYRYA